MKNECKEIAEKLFDLMNKSGRGDNEMADALIEAWVSDHRTHQQSFARTLRKVIEAYAEYDRHDLRNEGAVKWAKMIVKGGEEMVLPYI